MKRRIIKQGHNTLTITLPSQWAEKFKIKPGDEVDLVEQGKDLKITTENKGEVNERAFIDISGLMVPMVWRLISSVYRAGYNEVKISFEDKSFRDVYTAFTYNTIQVLKDGDEEQLSPLEAIQSLVNRFIGFEIIEQKTHYCIIKDLGNTNPKEFDNTLRRIFLLLQTMSEAVLTNLKEGKKEELKGVHIIDTNIDRFEDFCLRVLNKEGYSDFKKTSAMYSLIFVLEMVGDEFKKLGLHLLNFKKPKNKNIIKFATYSDNMLRTFYDLYYNFSNEKAEQVYKIDKDYADLFEKVYSDLAPEESELLHHLKKINIFMLSLTELRIDMAY